MCGSCTVIKMLCPITEGGAARGQVHGAFFSPLADELREREQVTSPFIQRPTPAASQCISHENKKGYFLSSPLKSLKVKVDVSGNELLSVLLLSACGRSGQGCITNFPN